ncbi:acyltransferase [Clostridium perfringens]|nr:acyltransferase [Clostridium perfringens]MDU2516343.1 acyltransferase [Clostridium perfringens]
MFIKLNKFKTIYYNIVKIRGGKIFVYNRSRIISNKRVKLSGNLTLGCPFINKFYDGVKGTSIIRITERGNCNFGKNIIIGPNVSIVIEKNGLFNMGDSSYISAETKILCSKEIIIGSGCSISWGTTIMDSDGKTILNSKESRKEVYIGNNVWIGSNVTILKGSCIGDGSIIASNSLVRGNFPNKSLIAGNPAKVVKENIEWK